MVQSISGHVSAISGHVFSPFPDFVQYTMYMYVAYWLTFTSVETWPRTIMDMYNEVKVKAIVLYTVAHR